MRRFYNPCKVSDISWARDGLSRVLKAALIDREDLTRGPMGCGLSIPLLLLGDLRPLGTVLFRHCVVCRPLQHNLILKVR